MTIAATGRYPLLTNRRHSWPLGAGKARRGWRESKAPKSVVSGVPRFSACFNQSKKSTLEDGNDAPEYGNARVLGDMRRLPTHGFSCEACYGFRPTNVARMRPPITSKPPNSQTETAVRATTGPSALSSRSGIATGIEASVRPP
jgi:hypothetical protein